MTSNLVVVFFFVLDLLECLRPGSTYNMCPGFLPLSLRLFACSEIPSPLSGLLIWEVFDQKKKKEKEEDSPPSNSTTYSDDDGGGGGGRTGETKRQLASIHGVLEGGEGEENLLLQEMGSPL